MGYPQQGQMPPAYQQNPYGQQDSYGRQIGNQGFPMSAAPVLPPPQMSNPQQQGDPFANSFDGADPFDNAMPEQRGQRAALAGPDGRPVIHTDGEPVMVSPPSLRTLGMGTLLLIIPKKIERDLKNTRKTKADERDTYNRMTADVIVCDGTGRMFGGDPTRGLDDMLGPYPVPCVIEDMWIDKDGIINRIPDNMIGTGFKIGRIRKTKTNSDRMAWILAAPDENPAQAAVIVQSLRPLWAAYLAQQLPILNLKTLGERYGVKPGAAPVQQTAPVQAYSPNAPMSPNPYVQQQSPQWPPMQPGQNMAPMQQGPAQPVSAPQWAPPAPTTPTAALADWTLQQTPPPGWEQSWAGLGAGQREQILGQLGVHNPNAVLPASVPPNPAMANPYGQPPPF
jgi:hypothetical protein